MKSVKYLLLLTDCKGESESPKPAMVSDAICKELGIWLGKNSVNLDRECLSQIAQHINTQHTKTDADVN